MDQLLTAPLDLRELFAEPWEGAATLWRPRWQRWLPAPSEFRFRTESLDHANDSWEVLDTITFPDGSIQQRRMHCDQLANGLLRLTADDMPDGAEVCPRQDGFDFTPYVIRTPVLGSLRVRLRHFDRVQLEPDGTLTDTIELRFLRVRVGILTMQLRRVSATAA